MGKQCRFSVSFHGQWGSLQNHWPTWGENIQFSALIDDEGLGCNYTKIDKTPMGTQHGDWRVWLGTEYEEFRVRSIYWVAMAQNQYIFYHICSS